MGITYLSESTDHYPPRKARESILPAALMALVGTPPGFEPKAARPARRCALPGCNNFTTHNGGYCCAEHCREHYERKG